MAQKTKDHPIYTAIKNDDADGLRKLAAAATSAEQRMSLQLLAEMVEDQVRRNSRRIRRFPFVGVRRRA